MGRGVSEGGRVGVSVGEAVGATVTVSVGAGSGSAVQVGTAVGVEGMISVTPPQAMSRRLNPERQIKNFFAIASLSASVRLLRRGALRHSSQ